MDGRRASGVTIIATYAPEPVRARILPAVCSGEAILAICMTEPDAGTDVANYKTNVDATGNALRLNGVKTLISRAEEAQMFVVFTRVIHFERRLVGKNNVYLIEVVDRQSSEHERFIADSAVTGVTGGSEGRNFGYW